MMRPDAGRITTTAPERPLSRSYAFFWMRASSESFTGSGEVESLASSTRSHPVMPLMRSK